MSLNDTEDPVPDERPPLDSGEWMQFVLDTCATVEDLVATDARVSIITVDHYLVADSLGNYPGHAGDGPDEQYLQRSGGDLAPIQGRW